LSKSSRNHSPTERADKKGVAWVWDSKKEQSVNELKSMVASGQILKMFDSALPVKLSVDSSQNGIGAVVL